MRQTKISLPILDTDVLVFNTELNKWQIDQRNKSDLMPGDWSWYNSNKNHISHWQYLPQKPI